MIKAIDRIGIFLKNWKINKKTLAIIFVFLFVCSLIPIIITTFYSMPAFDDYSFGLHVHKALINGDSFWNGVIESCSYHYNYWQGFYTNNFINSAQPFNIDISLYWISNLSYLFIICISMFYFIKVILIDVLKASKTDYVLISVPITTIFLQFMPGISQAIYNTVLGLSLITNFICLLIFSFVIKYHLSKSKKTKFIYGSLAIILSILISGTPPIIFITVFLISIVAILYCLHNKYKVYKLLMCILAIFFVGLLISVLAPGNAYRTDTVSGYPLHMAIIRALAFSGFFLGEWFTLFFSAFLVFIAIIFFNIAKTSNYSFKNPLLVFIISYLIYASRISIQIFATGSIGGTRQLNEYYLGFLISTTISFLYFVGWISKKDFTNSIEYVSKKISVITILIISFTFICGTSYYAYNNTVTSLATTVSLINGNTQTYHKEMLERLDMIENNSKSDVVVSPLSIYPPFFMEEPLQTNKDFWTNQSVAAYYEKDSIILVE